MDKLEWDNNALSLMEYIGIIESIYIPDLDDYDYRINVTSCEASAEAIEEARNIPFGATGCMVIFKSRFNQGLLSKQNLYNQYLTEREIQELISYLELDADKFWLLILFVCDYCESMFYQGTTMKSTPLEQLEQLQSAINHTDDTAILTFKAGKQKVVLEDIRAIKAISEAINKYISEADIDMFKYLSRRQEEETPTMLKESPFIAYFAKMLLTFFNTQQQIRAKRRAGANHSTKEMELVSRLVYFIRLSKNEKTWTDIENETLKAFLKQYKDYRYPHNISNIYPEFSI
ncbi:hypothetical protein [uncultured Bacteroides sp.]|uniref:hypothetical protein n=1 Tax=uncultured Bacteroides sp. TaxID=162156 RepID=UPI0026256642|nr:hypothetical protein [uncultured Bacteroides sp.]